MIPTSGWGLQDGALSNKELNAFQTKCFSAPLQPEELVGIKKVVADKVPGVSLWLCSASHSCQEACRLLPVGHLSQGCASKQALATCHEKQKWQDFAEGFLTTNQATLMLMPLTLHAEHIA